MATVRRVDLDAPKGFRRAIEYSVNRTVSEVDYRKITHQYSIWLKLPNRMASSYLAR